MKLSKILGNGYKFLKNILRKILKLDASMMLSKWYYLTTHECNQSK